MAIRSHILIAEDEKYAALALDAFLSGRGYRITVATNDATALATFDADPADLLLVGIGMLGKDGQILTAALRARQPNLPVIILTDHLTANIITAEPGAGRTKMLVRPITPEDLLAAISTALPPSALDRRFSL